MLSDIKIGAAYVCTTDSSPTMQDQLKDIVMYCDENDIVLLYIYTEVCDDAKAERVLPNLLLDDLKKDRFFEALVVTDIAQLAADPVEAACISAEYKARGVDLFAVA